MFTLGSETIIITLNIIHTAALSVATISISSLEIKTKQTKYKAQRSYET